MDPDLEGLFSDEHSSDEEEENNFESNTKRKLRFFYQKMHRYVILFSFYHVVADSPFGLCLTMFVISNMLLLTSKMDCMVFRDAWIWKYVDLIDNCILKLAL